MTYVEGFVAAVPAANKEAYRKHAAEAAPLFKEFGATRMVEAWGDDVPDGKVTDFKGAVKAKHDEIVVFAWLEYPVQGGARRGQREDDDRPAHEGDGRDMPFDGKRMIYGGFAADRRERASGKLGYVDGYIVPVPTAKKEAYREMAAKAAACSRNTARSASSRPGATTCPTARSPTSSAR